MRLTRLTFKDIGPFDEAVFTFPEPAGQGELVLFEGPNGSGKTTIVEAVAVAAWRVTGGHQFTFPAVRLLERFRAASGVAACTLDHQGQLYDLPQLAMPGLLQRVSAIALPPLCTVGLGTPSWKIHWAAFAFGGHQQTASLATEGPRNLGSWDFQGALSFGRSAPASGLLGQLLTNLENDRTKALIYARERAEPERRQELERLAESRREALRRFEHVLSAVLDRRVTIEFSIEQQAPTIRFDGEPIPLDLLGEGMRSTISWLANLLVNLERAPWEDTLRSPLDQDFWLILDEIDESLHPRMQARILPALRRLLPNARIYATTHSPFVVASIGEGVIFPIRPGPDHRVRGEVLPRRLEPGQSLELVTSEIFDVPAEFIDADTQEKLAAHERDIRALQQQGEIDWSAFLARRTELMKRNDEVRTAVSMQELPVRQTILRRVREQEERSAG